MSTLAFKALSIVTNVKQGELVKRLIEENEKLMDKIEDLRMEVQNLEMEAQYFREAYIAILEEE